MDEKIENPESQDPKAESMLAEPQEPNGATAEKHDISNAELIVNVVQPDWATNPNGFSLGLELVKIVGIFKDFKGQVMLAVKFKNCNGLQRIHIWEMKMYAPAMLIEFFASKVEGCATINV